MNNPAVFKKVLVKSNDLVPGHVQMINWAKLVPNKAFQAHYHQDMQEVFIILSGIGEIEVDKKFWQIEKGDTILIPIGAVHSMKNKGKFPLFYIALGISVQKSGRTVVVQDYGNKSKIIKKLAGAVKTPANVS